jgi:hypothetical protein
MFQWDGLELKGVIVLLAKRLPGSHRSVQVVAARDKSFVGIDWALPRRTVSRNS